MRPSLRKSLAALLFAVSVVAVPAALSGTAAADDGQSTSVPASGPAPEESPSPTATTSAVCC
ncbi:hypothetical protein ACL02U_07400 [Streptomyces sp. MS06]|uniref:hypothetical protein n=1 Tax=Streptomyces sp. MS06 TaxID=3385974 RepID=UPI0039A38F5A